MSNFEAIPYRIRLGIVGRRTLPNTDVLSQKMNEFLGDFPESPFWRLFTEKQRDALARLRADGRTPIQLEVLSPLAEGADRLAAQVVLARDGRSQWPAGSLRAVLPLAEEDYLETFEGPGAVEEFHKLMARSRRPVRLRGRRIAEERCAPADQERLRNDAYDEAGRYVVDHCDLLIALWDGKRKENGHDGTYDTVRHALTEGVPVYRIWTDAEELMKREADDTFGADATEEKTGRADFIAWLANVIGVGKEHNGSDNLIDITAAEGLDGYNRRSVDPAACSSEMHSLEAELFSYNEAITIPDDARAQARKWLFPHYCRASLEAAAGQRTYYRAGWLGYTLATTAVFCASLGVLFSRLEAYAFFAELVALCILSLMLWNVKRREAHRVWIEYRFLAERLRAAIFMALCGVEPKPVKVPEYMGHSQSENDWTIHAFDEIWSRLPEFSLPMSAAGNSLPHPSTARYIRAAWIQAQRKYHARKALTEGVRHKILSNIGEIVLPCSIVAAVVHLLMPGLAHIVALPNELHEALHDVPSLAALVLPAVAASLAGFLSLREHQRLEKRSNNMTRQLDVLDRRMADTQNEQEFRTILRDLDEEVMLRETQDWLMLMKYVEIKAG